MKKIFYLLILFGELSFSQICYSQSNNTNTHFKISGFVIGKDTGKVVLSYSDANNRSIFDTASIKNGKFVFLGTVNILSDANLWTDLKNNIYGDKTVIRFY